MKALEKERARRYETADRPRARRRALPAGRAGGSVSAVGLVSISQVRPAAEGRAGGGVGSCAACDLAAAGMLAVSNVRVSEALERERRNSYGQRIALANREWSANNLSRMEELLDECPDGSARLGMALSQATALQHASAHCATTAPFSVWRSAPTASTWPAALRPARAESGRRKPARNSKSGRPIKMSAHSVAFSPDGRYLATGSWDGKVKVWEMKKVLRGRGQRTIPATGTRPAGMDV